ncbi:MAG: hypothetical protein E7646_09770 [Ruminococcaceae bacterium]|nr:hypothetical protein [Oscillospiraceae bacterium]
MIKPEFLDLIEFTEVEKQKYLELSPKIPLYMDEVARDYVMDKRDPKEVAQEISDCADKIGIHQYTVELVMSLWAGEYLEKEYEKAGLSKQLFIDAMKDMTYKMRECVKYHGIFGTTAHTTGWFNGWFHLNRVALGRLQYDTNITFGQDLEICGIKLYENTPCLGCHIPSSGKLTRELCIESYKLAYKQFPEMRINGLLPIRCISWLLFTPYVHVFGEKGNTSNFQRSFYIYNEGRYESFLQDMTVYGKHLSEGDLPMETSLQRNFLKYINEINAYGYGYGLLLFDGENIVTDRNPG